MKNGYALGQRLSLLAGSQLAIQLSCSVSEMHSAALLSPEEKPHFVRGVIFTLVVLEQGSTVEVKMSYLKDKL